MHAGAGFLQNRTGSTGTPPAHVARFKITITPLRASFSRRLPLSLPTWPVPNTCGHHSKSTWTRERTHHCSLTPPIPSSSRQSFPRIFPGSFTSTDTSASPSSVCLPGLENSLPTSLRASLRATPFPSPPPTDGSSLHLVTRPASRLRSNQALPQPPVLFPRILPCCTTSSRPQRKEVAIRTTRPVRDILLYPAGQAPRYLTQQS